MATDLPAVTPGVAVAQAGGMFEVREPTLSGISTAEPAPLITNFVPAEGTTIARNGTFGFDVTGADGQTIQAEFPDGSVETVYKYDEFTARYINSTKVDDTFVLRRTNGWYATPIIQVVAFAGTVNV